MIGAGDPAGAAGAFDQPHHAVTANIREGSDLAFSIANAKDGLVRDRERQIVAGRLKIGGEPGAHPVLAKNPLSLQFGDIFAPIDRRRQAGGCVERTVCGFAKLVQNDIERWKILDHGQ